jgi:hypothetical protein
MDDLMAAMQAGLIGDGPKRISLERTPREEGPKQQPTAPEALPRVPTPESVQLLQDARDIREAAHRADRNEYFWREMAEASRLTAKAIRIEQEAARNE